MSIYRFNFDTNSIFGNLTSMEGGGVMFLSLPPSKGKKNKQTEAIIKTKLVEVNKILVMNYLRSLLRLYNTNNK